MFKPLNHKDQAHTTRAPAELDEFSDTPGQWIEFSDLPGRDGVEVAEVDAEAPVPESA